MISIGTYLGGVWANESWGRYWGWDAKETCDGLRKLANRLMWRGDYDNCSLLNMAAEWIEEESEKQA